MRRTFHAVLVALALAPFAARAASATASFTVTANVSNVCKIAANNVTFGVDVTTAGAQNQTGTITVNCTKGAPYSINLTSTNAWTLKGTGTNALPYVIYQPDASGNAATATAWDATHAWGATSASNAAKNLTMTVSVTPADVPAGAYTDSVTATVNF